MSYDNQPIRKETPLVVLTNQPEYGNVAEKEITLTLEEYDKILTFGKKLKKEDPFAFNYPKQSSYLKELTDLSSLSLEEFTPPVIDSREIRYSRYMISLENVVTTLKKVGNKIKELIQRLYLYIQQIIDKYFSKATKIKEMMEVLDKEIKKIDPQYDLDYKIQSNPKIENFCYYDGKSHTIREAVQELNIRYSEVSKAFNNRLPGYIEALEELIDSIKREPDFNKLSVSEKQQFVKRVKGLIVIVSNSLAVISPNYKPVLKDKLPTKDRSTKLTVQTDSMVLSYSKAFPGDYRVLSKVPFIPALLDAMKKKQNNPSLTYQVVFAGDESERYSDFKPEEDPMNLARGTSSGYTLMVFLNDLLKVKFSFEPVSRELEVTKEGDKVKVNIKEQRPEIEGLNGITLRQLIPLLKDMSVAIEKDRQRVYKVKSQAYKVITKLKSLPNDAFYTQELADSPFVSNKTFYVALLTLLRQIDQPYMKVFNYSLNAISMLADLAVSELKRYKSQAKDDNEKLRLLEGL